MAAVVGHALCWLRWRCGQRGAVHHTYVHRVSCQGHSGPCASFPQLCLAAPYACGHDGCRRVKGTAAVAATAAAAGGGWGLPGRELRRGGQIIPPPPPLLAQSPALQHCSAGDSTRLGCRMLLHVSIPCRQQVLRHHEERRGQG